MKRMKNGFTLLEVLVASLLLGMLVTILTMVFGQSSVAWRTGVAGVADLDSRRQDIARNSSLADAVLPRNTREGGAWRVIETPWKPDGTLRRRSVATGVSLGFDPANPIGLQVGGAMASISMQSFVVGVTSAGPDFKFNTGDDITTLPKKKDKK